MTNETALILSGEGYSLTITPQAEEQKRNLLVASAHVNSVTNNDESADAAYHMRSLAQMRILVDKSRKEIKEPVIRIGKLIDATAKNFLAEIEDEEARIKRLVGDHAEAVAVLQQEREAAERAAFEYAHKAREAAETAQDAAESTGKMSDIVAAKQAEQERQDTLAARMEASNDLASTKIAQGVRFAWDFEVCSIKTLHYVTEGLTEVTVKRSAILEHFKKLESLNLNVATWAETVGLRAFKKPIISTK
jgi:hypothetical protein